MGYAHMCGMFRGFSAQFGTVTLSSSGGFDLYVVSYDPSGNVSWALSGGGSNDDNANGVALDALGNTYIGGGFSSPTMTLGSTVLTNSGTYFDLYVAKLSPPPIGIEEHSSNDFRVFPNPADNNIQLQVADDRITSVWLYDAMGKEIIHYSHNLSGDAILNIASLSPGMYVLKIMTTHGTVVSKVMKE